MQLQTDLADRVLRFDGISIFHPDSIAAALSRGVPPSKIRVTEINEDVELFNQNVVPEDQLLAVSAEPVNIKMSWQLPKKYQDLDLNDYVTTVFMERSQELGFGLEPSEIMRLQRAGHRLDAELNEIKKRGMVEFTKTVIYILDTFREQGIVWGVGRGSSCASYVLFVLGLHVVDCLKYNVPMEEFFHD